MRRELETLFKQLSASAGDVVHKYLDVRWYEKMHYDNRLKDDTTSRFATAMAEWTNGGSDPELKPKFLHYLHEVSKEHWDCETEEFREEVRVANVADYEERKKDCKARTNVTATPRTPNKYEEYVRVL